MRNTPTEIEGVAELGPRHPRQNSQHAVEPLAPFLLRRQSTRSLWPILTLVVAFTAASSCTLGPTSSVTQVDLPVQLVNNLLFVSVRVGSSEALSFILEARQPPC
jgi:hypothetical protein